MSCKCQVERDEEVPISFINNYDMWWKDGTDSIVLEFPYNTPETEQRILEDMDGEEFVYYCELDVNRKRIRCYRCYKSDVEMECLFPAYFNDLQLERIKKILLHEGFSV